MKTKISNLIIIAVTSVISVNMVWAESEHSQEYKVKAAFLYNFIKFVDWPQEQMSDTNKPITIGIIGSEDFIKAFEPVKDKKIKDRNVSIKYFTGYGKLDKTNGADDSQWDKKIEELKVCHVLLFCSCNSISIRNSNQIIKALEGLPILTVGENEHFLEYGGIINFLMEDNKVCFEINAACAKRNKLKISSKLLRLAKRVIEDK